IVRGGARLEYAHRLVEAARVELAHEGGETVRAEWMAVAESVARQALADDHSHAAHVGREAPSRGVCASLTQRRFMRPGRHHAACKASTSTRASTITKPKAKHINTINR